MDALKKIAETLTNMVNDYESKQKDQIDQIILEISMMLNEVNVENSILYKRKNLFGIYRKYDKAKQYLARARLWALPKDFGMISPNKRIMIVARAVARARA